MTSVFQSESLAIVWYSLLQCIPKPLFYFLRPRILYPDLLFCNGLSCAGHATETTACTIEHPEVGPFLKPLEHVLQTEDLRP